jgi:hypothetical protein
VPTTELTPSRLNGLDIGAPRLRAVDIIDLLAHREDLLVDICSMAKGCRLRSKTHANEF